MHARTHAGYFNAEFVHSVAVWFPLLIKQQIQRRQRSSLANIIAAIGIFLAPASQSRPHPQFDVRAQSILETQFLSRARPIGRAALERRVLAIHRSKFRWSRLNLLSLSFSLKVLFLRDTGKAEMRPRASNKSEGKKERGQSGGRERGGSNFAISSSLSLSLLFSPVSWSGIHLIYVTIRHSILLYSSAYETPPFWQRGARETRISGWEILRVSS